MPFKVHLFDHTETSVAATRGCQADLLQNRKGLSTAEGKKKFGAREHNHGGLFALVCFFFTIIIIIIIFISIGSSSRRSRSRSCNNCRLEKMVEPTYLNLKQLMATSLSQVLLIINK